MNELSKKALSGRTFLNCIALISLAAISVALAVGVFSLGYQRLEKTRLVWRLEFSLIVALWARRDRTYSGFAAPFEFDAFMFFAWPVVLPFYLYWTRRKLGLIATMGVYILSWAPAVAEVLTRVRG